MILELDCGNTRIKWRSLKIATGGVAASGVVTGLAQLDGVLSKSGAGIDYCRVASVRGAEFNQCLRETLRMHVNAKIEFACSRKELAAVRNAYAQPDKLGVDRWLALVAAYTLYPGNCMVIDCGTAVTVDLVNAQGQHLGGVIAPGLRLLQQALSAKTGLPTVADADCGDLTVYASTELAICGGVHAMYSGFLQQQRQVAEHYFKGDFVTVVAGGDAELCKQVLKGAVECQDLIFCGLSLAHPYEGSDA